MTFSKAYLKTDKEPNLKLRFGEEKGWPHGGDLIHGLISSDILGASEEATFTCVHRELDCFFSWEVARRFIFWWS